jgi:putative aminopeptidase FrvX
MVVNMEYVMGTLEKLLKIPSPSGRTQEITGYIEKELKELNVSVHKTAKGGLIATILGKNDTEHRTISAHIDTLGAMVKEIKSNGRLKLTQIGSYSWNSIEGEYCIIETSEGKKYTGTILSTKASAHVYGQETSKLDRNENTIEVRLDEKVKNTDDIRNLGINVGDYVFFDTRTVITEGGFIKSRHLDDKAGVAVILGAIRYIIDNSLTPSYTTHFFFSNYEEVGHGASAAIPEKTSEFLAIDMAAIGDGQTSDEYSVTICAKDSTGPYDFELKQKLVKIAVENNINYKIDIYPYYGSDASAALRAGWNFKHGLIGPGVDASHAYERTHREAIENTLKLTVNYILL